MSVKKNIKILIEDFVKQVNETEQSFSICIEGERKNYFFLQGNVGDAKYIYGTYGWDKHNFHSNIDLKPELVAIKKERIIYLVNSYFFGIYHLGIDDIPENVELLDSFWDDWNEKVRDNIFPAFYDPLEVKPITDEKTILACRDAARNILLLNAPNLTYPPVNFEFGLQDAADNLCGFVDLEEDAKRRMASDNDKWIASKSAHDIIKKLVEEKSITAEWELRISSGLKSVQANTVMVEFEVSGKKGSAKMDPQRILRHLVSGGYFCGYDFENKKQGKKLIEELGAGKWESDKKPLKCNNIAKITYGRKELYVKQQGE